MQWRIRIYTSIVWKNMIRNGKFDERKLGSDTELPVGDYMFRVRAASNPAAIKAVRVVVAGNTPFIWIVVLSVIVCCILIYFYLGYWGHLHNEGIYK